MTKIRDQFKHYHNFKGTGLNVHARKLPAALENLCCEIYNPGNEEITFQNAHPTKHIDAFFGMPPKFWETIKCPPGEWIFLPHGQYIQSVPSGHRAYRVIINVGDKMFCGNKLPSRPDGVKKMQVFT